MPVGGIETWLYYLAKLHPGAFTVYYKKIDNAQLLRLAQYVDCVKYNDEVIKLDKGLFCFDMMGLDKVIAKEYIHIVHADYQEIAVEFKPARKFDNIYGVSELACDSFTEVTGVDAEVLYNPIALDDTHPVIKLISATRLSEEKGLWRMFDLAKALDDSGIKYRWDIYSNDKCQINSPNVTVHKPRLDMASFIADADYLVQLSDTESFCYSLVESLTLGTPVITTFLPVLGELGIRAEHGIIIPLNEFDFDKYVPLLEKGKRVFYAPPESNWSEIFE
jgi:glycosyltransferase involved in cell wall biosynthesis